MNVNAIIFDMGDTLVPTSSSMIAGASCATQNMHKLSIINDPKRLASKFIEVDNATYFPHINHLFSHIEIVKEAIAKAGVINPNIKLSLLTIAGIFLAIYRRKISQLLQPDLSINSLLNKLRNRGYKLGIISNGTLEEQIEVLVRMNLIEYFDDVVISEEFGVEKPDATIFHIAAKRLGIAPKEILYIGDSWEDDILGAKSASFQAGITIQFKNELDGVDLNETNFLVLRELNDIISLLDI